MTLWANSADFYMFYVTQQKQRVHEMCRWQDAAQQFACLLFFNLQPKPKTERQDLKGPYTTNFQIFRFYPGLQ